LINRRIKSHVGRAAFSQHVRRCFCTGLHPVRGSK
jgi:hypothetical protein